jgi:hypothetical protein
LFKNDDYDFYLTSDFVLSMPFNSVNELTSGKWTNLNKKWLNRVHQTRKQASSNSILEVKFSWSIMTNNISGKSTQFINPAKRHIYLVTLNNKERTKFYVNYTQIHNIVGKEEWMKGESNCICNIGGNGTLILSLGAKQKSTKWSQVTIGGIVAVSNHGTKLLHLAKVIKIDHVKKTAEVKWDVTRKNELVKLKHCQKYNVEETSQRKRKNIDRYAPLPEKKIHQESLSEDAPPICPNGEMINLFYSKDNISKLCAEGSIANLMNMLHMSTEDLDCFWHLVKFDPIVLQTSLRKPVPKRVLQGSLVHGLLSLDSIEKSVDTEGKNQLLLYWTTELTKGDISEKNALHARTG